MQRSSRMTSTGFWADPAKTGQLEDLVAQLVLVGMCAMLIVGLVYWAVARRAHRTWHTALTDDERRGMRAENSQRLYRVLEALDPRATTLDLAPSDLEGLSPTHRQQLPPVRQAGHASSGQSVIGAAVAKRDEGAAVHAPRVVPVVLADGTPCGVRHVERLMGGGAGDSPATGRRCCCATTVCGRRSVRPLRGAWQGRRRSARCMPTR
jgi:hypothetical protein